MLRDIRPSDYVLTGVLAAAAAYIGVMNITATTASDLAHPVESHSVLLVPVFVLAVLPLLWRRRHVVAALAVSCLVLAVSLPAFGWVTRCGFALPLSMAFAYAVARFARSGRLQAAGLVLVLVHQVLTLVQDSSTGGLEALALGVPLAALGYGAGVVARRVSAQRAVSPTLSVEHVHA